MKTMTTASIILTICNRRKPSGNKILYSTNNTSARCNSTFQYKYVHASINLFAVPRVEKHIWLSRQVRSCVVKILYVSILLLYLQKNPWTCLQSVLRKQLNRIKKRGNRLFLFLLIRIISFDFTVTQCNGPC